MAYPALRTTKEDDNGGGVRARTLNPYNSETAKDSPIICKKDRSRLGNLIQVVWKLYEVV